MRGKVILVLLMVLVTAGMVMAMSATQAQKPANPEKLFAGREVKVLTNKDGYSLLDIKTGEIILNVNFTAINENLDGKPAITKEEAVKKASEFCEGYTLVRATENPYDFDILFERQIDGIAVFAENCYVSINKMTGKIAAYRKMRVEDVKFIPEIRVSREKVLKMTGSVDAKLLYIPEIGVVWITSSGSVIDAETGKKLGKEEINKVESSYRTTVEFNSLATDETSTVIESVNNNDGAVFRDEQGLRSDDILKAKIAMEKERPNNQPAWDSDGATSYGTVYDEVTVNSILYSYEGVYFAGHGNHTCISLGGDADYCKDEIASNRQTRLFVVSACEAGNEFAQTAVNKGVQCVIGASGTIYDTWLGWSECANWADLFWDRATGNKDAGYQRTAHTARVEANAATTLEICDLDVEKGTCDIYI